MRTAIRLAYSPAARLLPDNRDTSTRSGWHRPGRASARSCRSGGRASSPPVDATGVEAAAPPPPSRRAVATASCSVVLHLPHAQPRRDLDRPERLGHPHVPDPRDEPLILQRLAERAVLLLAARARPRRRGRAPAETSRPIRAGALSTASTGPFQALQLLAAEDEPGPAAALAPRGSTRQRPVMRRWLRTVTSSRRRNRFLPTAVTDSRIRPSTRSATPVGLPRGCGTRPAGAGRRAAAAGARRGGESRPRARARG